MSASGAIILDPNVFFFFLSPDLRPASAAEDPRSIGKVSYYFFMNICCSRSHKTAVSSVNYRLAFSDLLIDLKHYFRFSLRKGGLREAQDIIMGLWAAGYAATDIIQTLFKVTILLHVYFSLFAARIICVLLFLAVHPIFPITLILFNFCYICTTLYR